MLKINHDSSQRQVICNTWTRQQWRHLFADCGFTYRKESASWADKIIISCANILGRRRGQQIDSGTSGITDKSGLDSQQGQEFLFCSRTPVPVWVPLFLILWLSWSLWVWLQRPANKTDHASRTSTEVNTVWNCTSTPPRLCGVKLN